MTVDVSLARGLLLTLIAFAVFALMKLFADNVD